MNPSDPVIMKFFAIHGSEFLGRRAAAIGGFDLSPVQEFRSQSHTAFHPVPDVEDQDVFIMQGLKGLYGDTYRDIAERSLNFARSCHVGGARTVTLIDPYSAMRQPSHRATPPVANGYEGRGNTQPVDCFVTLDDYVSPHEGVPYCRRATNLSMCRHIARAIVFQALGGPLVLLSNGDINHGFMDQLHETIIAERRFPPDLIRLYELDDQRLAFGCVNPDIFREATVLIVDQRLADDDVIMQMARIARACGATRVEAYATHNMHPDPTLSSVISNGCLDRLTLTDSTKATALMAPPSQVRVLSCAGLIADLVLRHCGMEDRSKDPRPDQNVVSLY